MIMGHVPVGAAGPKGTDLPVRVLLARRAVVHILEVALAGSRGFSGGVGPEVGCVGQVEDRWWTRVNGERVARERCGRGLR
jgi:hypothetical protein